MDVYKLDMTNGKRTVASKSKEKDEVDRSTGSQRALVLQGGGALAAYEAGVYCALYFWIKKDWQNNEKNSNIYDVVAGTSGGAINASIVISHVLEMRKQKASITDSWSGSPKKLIDFWNHLSSNPDYFKWNPGTMFGDIVQEPSPVFPYYYYAWKWPSDKSSWKVQWQKAHNANPAVATPEAARRYYSAKEYLYAGAQNVFSRSTTEYDDRFFDDVVMPTNTWYHYSDAQLNESIKQYATFPIATTFGKGEDEAEERKQQPRLLLVSVDVATGAVVTFDSYEKDQNGTRKSMHGDYAKKGSGPQENDNEITMVYKDGIEVDHVMASSSVPINYDYTSVPVDYSNISKGYRKFWDGGILSNTPLRELIQAHEDYWTEVKKQDIPDLTVYIANIWPIKGGVPSDHDGAKNRLYDLRYQDKTMHEEKVAYLVHDYIDLVDKLVKRARDSQIEIDDILDSEGKSRHRDGKYRKYGELLKDKVRISDVIRIQREPDPEDVSAKLYDFSSGTISNLVIQGVREALKQLAKPLHASEAGKKDLSNFIGIVEREKEKEKLEGQFSNILKDTNMYRILKESAEALI